MKCGRFSSRDITYGFTQCPIRLIMSTCGVSLSRLFSGKSAENTPRSRLSGSAGARDNDTVKPRRGFGFGDDPHPLVASPPIAETKTPQIWHFTQRQVLDIMSTYAYARGREI